VNLAAVYSREIDGEILTLSASGWNYRNTFVLYDYETETLWYHLEGQAGLIRVSGFYADRRLHEFKSTFTRWNDWTEQHPEMAILKVD
tara:strand:+ start:763 stop:1026 length:264 start_codon:yes stop_codon:yes gene_type:complete